LITLVDISTHAPMQNILRQPAERIFGERLRGAAEVGEFGRINASEANVNLFKARD